MRTEEASCWQGTSGRGIGAYRTCTVRGALVLPSLKVTSVLMAVERTVAARRRSTRGVVRAGPRWRAYRTAGHLCRI